MYYVEMFNDFGDTDPLTGWRRVPFAEHRTRTYCDGYVTAYDSMYPSQPMRIVKVEKDGTTKVVRETKGRGSIHLN